MLKSTMMDQGITFLNIKLMTEPFQILTHNQVTDLTGKKRADAQIRALNAMGIPYEVNPAGKPKVLAEVMRRRAGLNAAPARTTPNFDVLN